jgi:cupin 2 domain-containing protein
MKTNLYAQIPGHAAQEVFTGLLSTGHVRIERIVSFGQTSPAGFWYEQAEGEWILLLEGSAQLRLGEQIVDLIPGDYLNIPAGTPHRVEKTAGNGPTIWLAVFYK